ncbi:porin family protein [Flavobacterium sp. W1B]|uniref:porin family protein n=1 Tax=Flavobacterium sp. W1B TaxID=3394146 RepID=UPI0039BCC8CA
MKKVILAAVAVFAFSFANAQEAKFGIKGGLNFANFSGDIQDNTTLVGFNVGGFAEINVSDKFAIQPELLYSTQGADGDGGNFKTAYVNIPVMIKYLAAPKFNLEVGPQVGFLTSAKVKEDGGLSGDVKKLFKSTDFGLNFGAGYDFTEKISVGVRYNLGLSNLFTEEFDALLGEKTKVHNSVLSLSLACKF